MRQQRVTAYEFRELQKAESKPTKWHNKRTPGFDHGTPCVFDSTGEAVWYAGLEFRERAGEIRSLKRQVRFTIQKAKIVGGNRLRAIQICVDATYEERYVFRTIVSADSVGLRRDVEYAWRFVIADYKAIDKKNGKIIATQTWRNSWKMLQAKLGDDYRFVIATKEGEK